MYIEKRGKSFRVSKMVDGVRYNLSFDHSPTKKEVKEALNDEINKSSGISSIKRGFLFKDALEEYINLKELLSPSTIAGYRKIQRNLPAWFLNTKLKDIDNTDIQRLINELNPGRSPKTVSNYFGLVGAVIRYYNPVLNIRVTLPAKVKVDKYIPNDHDIKLLFQEAINTRYYVPLLLAAYGLRRSEILALSMDDLHDDYIDIHSALVYDEHGNKVIKNTNKTYESSRKIYIPEEIISEIRKRGLYSGDPSGINDFISSRCDKLGIPHFTLHTLRHFFATKMSMILPEADVLALGGWSNPHVMKNIYRHAQVDRSLEMQAKIRDAYKDIIG